MNPWWTYEDGNIPGAGKWMLNVATGNLIIQDDDIDVPERGIDLAFRRTYNSQSRHDYANTDGSVPSNYGNGWTNFFDAHVAYNSLQKVISVYDGDGARYDYTANGAGGWVAPPGVRETLTYDGCLYTWQKKSGTMYRMYAPYATSCIGSGQSVLWGKLANIYARNINNHLNFAYSYGNATDPATLTGITVIHSDGHQLSLSFADFNGRRLLSAITRPDGQVVRYAYDGNGNLTDVCDIGNGNTDGSPSAAGICGDTTHQHHRYGWNANYQIEWADSPKWTMTWGGSDQTGSGGAYATFAEDASSRATAVQYVGYVNIEPNDGMHSFIQPTMNTNPNTVFRNLSFAYLANSTQYTDTDGHATTWTYDSTNRVIQTSEYTGTAENKWLVTNECWDGSNNLICSKDALGNETDYGYDGNGNTLWIQQPWVQTNWGNIRPVARYSYDQFNNLLSYCDPIYVGQTGVTTCPQGAGVTYYKYDYSDTANEPYGRLTDSYTPKGYHRSYTYGASGQQGQQWGLVTDINGDSFAQADGSTVAPHAGYSYDAFGNATYYGAGVGNWTLTYDRLNRLASATDPDGVTSHICYNADDSASFRQSAVQYQMDGSVVCKAGGYSDAYTYDDDGFELSLTSHHGQTTTNTVASGVTQKWYDGLDRMVEIQSPSDAADDGGAPEETRYLYDITQSNNTPKISVGGSFLLYGFGNLFETDRCVFTAANSGCQWMPVSGSGYDGLDRATQKLSYVPGDQSIHTETYQYDADSTSLGLLKNVTAATGAITTFTYDGLGRESAVQFTNDGGLTSPRTYGYDADGHLLSIASCGGQCVESFAYDQEGNIVTKQEPTNGLVSAPATLTYGYYPNGWRKSLSVYAPPAYTATTTLYQYSYRLDGRRTTLSTHAGNFVWAFTNAGRTLSQTDPSTGSTMGKRTFTYDGNGEVSSLTLPEGWSYPNVTHDAEGSVATYGVNDPYPYQASAVMTTHMSMGYTTRGEFSSAVFNGGQEQFSFCDGHQHQSNISVNSCVYTQSDTGGAIFDPRLGVSLATTSGHESTTTNSIENNWSFDGSGRQTTANATLCTINQTTYQQQCTNEGTSERRSYDAEDHLVSRNCGNFSNGCHFNTNIAWGPSGKLASIGYTTGALSVSNSMHWDGSTLLFITDSTGNLADEFIEQLATGNWDAQGNESLVALDRDLFGLVAAAHNATGSSSWIATQDGYKTGAKDIATANASSEYPPFGSGFPYGGPYAPGQYFLGVQGADGYSFDGLSFQGVRSYDEGLTQWTSPDALANTIGDPMSSRPYMWNRNNPLDYADPTGYEACNKGRDSGNGTCNIAAPLKEIVKVQSCWNCEKLRQQFKKDNAQLAFWNGFLELGSFGLGGAGAGASKTLEGIEAARAGSRVSSKAPTFFRYMSRAEAQATKASGLLRGGRSGMHWVTQDAISSAKAAKSALALEKLPEVRLEMELHGGTFEGGGTVEPLYNEPGGGTEAKFSGDVPVTILNETELGP